VAVAFGTVFGAPVSVELLCKSIWWVYIGCSGPTVLSYAYTLATFRYSKTSI